MTSSFSFKTHQSYFFFLLIKKNFFFGHTMQHGTSDSQPRIELVPLHQKLRDLATGPPGNSSSRGIFLKKKKKKSPHHLPAFSSPWLVGVSLCLVWCTGLPKSDPVLFLKPCCPSSSSPACYTSPLWNCPYRLHLGLWTCLDVFPTLKPCSHEGLHGLHEAGFLFFRWELVASF